MKIGLDLDNCVFDSEPLYKQAFTRTEYTYHLPMYYSIEKSYPEKVAKNLKKIFKSNAVFWTNLFEINLPGIINTLVNDTKHEIHIITARETFNAKENTIKQLNRNKIYIPAKNIHVSDFNKIDIIKQLNIDIMFDDSPIVIEECIKNNIECILISTPQTPYNHYLRSKVPYYNTLSQALKQKIK